MEEPDVIAAASIAKHDQDHQTANNVISTTKLSSTPLAKPTRKCSQACFLLSALTVAQVMLLSLFVLWTVKTCYVRYQRVYIVIDEGPGQQTRSVPRSGIHNQRNHGNQRDHVIDHSTNIIRMPFSYNNRSTRNPKNSSQNFTIVGTTGNNGFDFALNWYESLKSLGLKYDVVLDVRGTAFDKFAKGVNKSKPFGDTRMHVAKQLPTPDRQRSGSSGFDVVLDLLMKGRDVLRIDTESVWLRDPMPLVWREYAHCDMCVTPGVRGAESTSSSFVFFKSTPAIVSFVALWMAEGTNSSHDVHEGVDDIDATFSRAVQNGPQTLRVCRLDASNFPTVLSSAYRTRDRLDGEHAQLAHVLSAGAIKDPEVKRDFLLGKHLRYLRRRSKFKPV